MSSSMLEGLQSLSWADLKSIILSTYEDRPMGPPPTNMFESFWLNLVEYFGQFYLLIAFYLFMNVCYLAGAFIFWVIERMDWFRSYKIQPVKTFHSKLNLQTYATTLDYFDCLKNLVMNYVFIITPLICCFYPIFVLLDFQMALPLPPIHVSLAHFMFCVLCEDVAQFYLHRALHWNWLYKNVHKVHHTYSAPFGLAASYAHPLEVIILGIATFSGPLIIRPHFSTFLAWILYRQLDAVHTHSGYDLPHLFDLLPYYGGVKMHDYHHKSFIFNFSSRFDFMDRIYGTYRDAPSSQKTKGRSKS